MEDGHKDISYILRMLTHPESNLLPHHLFPAQSRRTFDENMQLRPLDG